MSTQQNRSWLEGVPIVALGVSVVIVFCSYFVTPMEGGGHGAPGYILQPLAWLLAVAFTAIGVLVSIPVLFAMTMRIGRGEPAGAYLKVGLVVTLTVLTASILQLLFAFFGPDL